MGFFSSIGHAFGSASDFLTGSGQPDERNVYGNQTPQEQQLNSGIQSNLNNLYANQAQHENVPNAQDQQLQDLFRQHLNMFMNTASSDAAPNQDQIDQATKLTDATFTNPAKAQLDQYTADFNNNQNATAASLGRNPNADVATQQAIYSEGLKNNTNLQAERGARIASQAQDFNNQNYSRGLANLNAGFQGTQGITGLGLQNSSFLNDLQQQAFANRMGVLNGQTNLSNLLQNSRKQQAVPGNTPTGFLGSLNSIQNGITNTASGGSQNYKTLTGLLPTKG